MDKSPAGALNKRDWLNSLKHIGIVAGAAAVAAVVPEVPGLVDNDSMLVPLLSGVLTLLVRWMQDNTR